MKQLPLKCLLVQRYWFARFIAKFINKSVFVEALPILATCSNLSYPHSNGIISSNYPHLENLN